MNAQRSWYLGGFGWALALPVLLLLTIGLAAIHATDRSELGPAAPGASAEPLPLLQSLLGAIGPTTGKQLLFLLGGVLILAAILAQPYQRWGRLAFAFYWFMIGLLCLLMLDHFVDLKIVPLIRNTRRWIGWGAFAIQPSEFMKIALVVALARYLRFRDSYRRWRGLIPPFLLTLLPMILILEQPDLGTLLMLLPVLFAMLFVAGARLRHLLTIVLLGLSTLPVFYFVGMKDYQRKRIDMLLRQSATDERWHQNEGYQLRQSKTALALGGVWGEGYGEGVFIGYALLPEEHNDFIFAIIGNQWGLAGCVLVILGYAVIVVVGSEIAMRTNDPFGRLLAVGVVVMIVAQAILNICMTIGLAPITGMPLPFVSAGGSSLWANFLAFGLLVNVAQRRPLLIAKPPFEHRE